MDSYREATRGAHCDMFYYHPLTCSITNHKLLCSLQNTGQFSYSYVKIIDSGTRATTFSKSSPFTYKT